MNISKCICIKLNSGCILMSPALLHQHTDCFTPSLCMSAASQPLAPAGWHLALQSTIRLMLPSQYVWIVLSEPLACAHAGKRHAN